MKHYHWAMTIAVISALGVVGCKKSDSQNTAPTVETGDVQFVYISDNIVQLKGVAFDMQNNITRYSWKKISGPEAYRFENDGSLQTTVHDLELGEYKFELVAIDADGLQGRDTTTVKVVEAGDNEVNFNDVAWQCPMGCSAVVHDINFYIPSGGYEVYVRESATSSWVRAVYTETWNGEKYTYSADTNTLYISSVFESEPTTPINIKITF